MTRIDRTIRIARAIEAISDPDALARLDFAQYCVMGSIVTDLLALDEWPDDKIVVEIVQQFGLARPAPAADRLN